MRQAQERLAAARQEAAQLEELLGQAQQAVAARENAVQGYQLRLEGRRQRAQAAQEQWNKLTLDVGEQLRRAKLLEDLERNLEGFAQSVKQVMKEAHRGMLSGVCGPVSQLLKTPREYAVALETALGASMQHVVVETEQDAKNAIRLLKQRDWGRATFLPLSTIRGERVQRPIDIRIACRALWAWPTRCAPARSATAASGTTCWAAWLWRRTWTAPRPSPKRRATACGWSAWTARWSTPGASLTGGSRGRNSGLLSRTSEIERVKEKAAALQQQAAKAQEEYRQRQEELSACEGQLSRRPWGAFLRPRGAHPPPVRGDPRGQGAGAAGGKRRQLGAASAATAPAALRELAQREREIRAAIAQLEEQVRQSQEENQRLTGSRQEQMAHCDEISQTIQEIRMGELSAQKDRDTLLAAVAGLEERKRDSAGAVERLRGGKSPPMGKSSPSWSGIGRPPWPAPSS